MSDDKGDKLNLDLIQRVQQARMLHDAEAKPSEMAAVYWIEAKDKTGTAPAPTPHHGEWVIETDLEHVDALWETIKAATAAGKLGYKSKVATVSRSLQKGVNHRVILVRTYDADDQDDIARVRAALIALGVTGEIAYHRT